jgi:glycosyltransferase involved in cell wall biosynthesis
MINDFKFFIEEFNSSGGIKITSSICNLLENNKLNVSIIVLNPRNCVFYELNKNIEILYAPKKSTINRFIWMAQIILKSKSVMITPNFRLSLMLFFFNFFKFQTNKIVFLIQGIDNISIIKHKNYLVRIINTALYYISKNIQANRVFVSRHIKNVYKRDGLIIPNYCSDVFFNSTLEARKYSPKSPLVIGIVSTSSTNKGFNIFIDFVDYMYNNYKDLDLVFKCATQDTKLINECSNANISFETPKGDDKMARFYKSCDFLLSLSISEGFNLPIIEAMSSGCVVFTTDDGASSEIIKHQINGIILKSRDVDCLVQQFLTSYNNEVLLNKISQNAVSSAKQFSQNSFNYSYLTYFKNNYG